MSRTLSLLVCVSALAHAQNDPLPKLKADAEREARSDSKVGCTELLAETRLACVESVTRGLQVNCFSLVTALKMALKQRSGKVFKMADAAQDAKVADASCRVHLKSIARARKKSGALTDAAAAPAECQELKGVLEGCFTEFETAGAFSRPCEQSLTIMNLNRMVKPGEAGASCRGPLDVYKMLSSQHPQER